MNAAVIGLGLGDEGKGRTVDFLARQGGYSAVVRFNGGPQAAHTVVNDGRRHVFSMYGSGALQGLPTYLGPLVAVMPEMITKEHLMLKNLNRGTPPVMRIHADCPLITPYDTMANQADSVNKAHGTCGMGFGKTVKRNLDGVTLSWGDFADGSKNLSNFQAKLAKVDAYYGKRFSTDYERNLVYRFIRHCEMLEKISSVWADLPEGDLIYEGAQGLMLDQQMGTIPHVTWSKTDMTNIRLLDNRPIHVYGCLRIYGTRHGNGPIVGTGDFKVNDPTNRPNVFQGTLRAFGWDLAQVAEVVRNCDIQVDTLVVGHLDDYPADLHYTDLEGNVKYVLGQSGWKQDFMQATAAKELLLFEGPGK